MALAEVGRPHGVRGEVRLRPFNRDSNLLLELEEVLVRLADGSSHEVSIEHARRTPDAILMKLYSVDDRDRAEELRGATVCVRRGELPPLDPGEFYACDVEGAAVVVAVSGEEPRPFGRVRTLRSYPSADVLVVDTGDGGKPFEVPLVEAFVSSVDVEHNVVTLTSTEGLERE